MTKKEPPSRLQRMLRVLAAYAFRDKLPLSDENGSDAILPPSVFKLPIVHSYCVSGGANGIFELSRVEIRKDPVTGTMIKITQPALRVLTGDMLGTRDINH